MVPGALLIILLVALGTASAVATPMAYDTVAGHATTPDSALWGLERAGESLKLIFIPSPVEKAKFHLALAEERIAEARASNNSETIVTAVNESIGELAKAMAIADGLNSSELYELVYEATSIHQEKLSELLTKIEEEEMPKEAKDAISQAIDVSRKGQEEALERIGGRP
jgi:hypothetical protein